MVESLRMDITKLAPEAYKHLLGLEQAIAGKLDRKLYHLLKVRASQINGCAFCLVMHTNEARQKGENDERMHLLNAWREAPVFSERERAALAWVEAVTLVAEDQVPDDVYQQARKQFSEKELVDLTLAAIAINSWNRASIAFRITPQLTVAKMAA